MTTVQFFQTKTEKNNFVVRREEVSDSEKNTFHEQSAAFQIGWWPAWFLHHAISTSGKSDVKSAVNFLYAQVHQLQAENMLPIPRSRKLGLPTEIRRRLLFLAVAALNILPSAHIRRGEEEGGEAI